MKGHYLALPFVFRAAALVSMCGIGLAAQAPVQRRADGWLAIFRFGMRWKNL